MRYDDSNAFQRRGRAVCEARRKRQHCGRATSHAGGADLNGETSAVPIE